MRRSGAPSLRRKDAPERSNLEILALLNSNSQSLNQSNSNSNSFVPPLKIASKSPGFKVSQFQSTKINLGSPVPKSQITTAFNNSSPSVQSAANPNHELVTNNGFSNRQNLTTFTAPSKQSAAATSCSLSGFTKTFAANAVEKQSIEPESSAKDEITKYYSCVWCKKSGRKHKKWEGDGVVKIGERSVVLIDEDGKELGRGSGYKVADLQDVQDGQLIPVGSKEIEITGSIDKNEWDAKVCSGKENAKTNSSSQESTQTSKKMSKGQKRKVEDVEELEHATQSPQSKVLATLLKRANTKKFVLPRRTDGGSESFTVPRPVAPGAPMYDAHREGALVLPRPPPGHPLHTDKLVDVVVDPYIGIKLRQHQRAGIIFMYRNILGMETVTTEDGDFKLTGCILADDMGLGKTLQTISVIWTLLKQSPVAGTSLARKFLIVAPASLLNNWENEFKKWLGSTRIIIHVADNVKKVAAFKSYRTAPVLIISYEMLVRAEEELKQVRWDLMVCDEAHRLKNSEIKTSTALSRLGCEKKLLLTGTPVQNDLQEYYCLMSTVAPGLLGSKASFTANYVNKIEKGREPGVELEVSEEAELALNKLSEISRKLVLRRTSDILSSHLPPKTTCVVFCRPSEFQTEVYSREVEKLYSRVTAEPGTHLTAIGRLKKICNSPFLVDEFNSPGKGPNTWEEQSGKLSTLTCLLLTVMQSTEEKVVLVSLSTTTLDLLETLCSRYNLASLRLDGKTPPAARQTLVNRFNKPDYPERVFLLSSKAGGTGLNLIGASRIVLYDIDWNPATDLQVMSRIWRNGQKRHCYIYRLVTTGTIEEKIYQRQVMKSGLAGGIETSSWEDLGKGAHFTPDELKDLFTFRSDTECDTHDLLGCTCGGSGYLQNEESTAMQTTSRSCQLGAVKPVKRSTSNMEKLLSWRHYTAPIYEKISDECLGSAESFITFIFSHYQDSNQQ